MSTEVNKAESVSFPMCKAIESGWQEKTRRLLHMASE